MTNSVFLSPKSIAIIGASDKEGSVGRAITNNCLLYTSPSPRDGLLSRMPSSA